jgi:hypothetical protein
MRASGRAGYGPRGPRGREERAGWRGGLDPAQLGGKNFLFLFLFLFLLSPFSFEQIFSYIFLGVKNILCEVLLTIMVYAYDEMSYEVGFQEIISGEVRRFRVSNLGIKFWAVTI